MIFITSLIILSHSKKIAEGAAELAAEMNNDLNIFPVGGTADGSLGADYNATLTALTSALKDTDVLILFDLGSTLMTVQMAIEEFSPEDQKRIFISDSALVEGSIVAATSIGPNITINDVLSDLTSLSLGKI